MQINENLNKIIKKKKKYGNPCYSLYNIGSRYGMVYKINNLETCVTQICIINIISLTMKINLIGSTMNIYHYLFSLILPSIIPTIIFF